MIRQSGSERHNVRPATTPSRHATFTSVTNTAGARHATMFRGGCAPTASATRATSSISGRWEDRSSARPTTVTVGLRVTVNATATIAIAHTAAAVPTTRTSEVET